MIILTNSVIIDNRYPQLIYKPDFGMHFYSILTWGQKIYVLTKGYAFLMPIFAFTVTAMSLTF